MVSKLGKFDSIIRVIPSLELIKSTASALLGSYQDNFETASKESRYLVFLLSLRRLLCYPNNDLAGATCGTAGTFEKERKKGNNLNNNQEPIWPLQVSLAIMPHKIMYHVQIFKYSQYVIL